MELTKDGRTNERTDERSNPGPGSGPTPLNTPATEEICAVRRRACRHPSRSGDLRIWATPIDLQFNHGGFPKAAGFQLLPEHHYVFATMVFEKLDMWKVVFFSNSAA
eukprot:gene12345-biopygen560